MNATTTALMLRTCRIDGDGNLISRYGFRWARPDEDIGHGPGVTVAPDWNPGARCGNGLHGCAWGEGDGRLLDWSDNAVWMVVEYEPGDAVDLGGKIKVPRGRTVFVGDRNSATDYLAQNGADGRVIIGGTATAGDDGVAASGFRGTSTSGDYGTSVSRDYGTSTSGNSGTSASGYFGTSTSGYRGTSLSGEGGTSVSGYGGTLCIKWWDSQERRYRLAVAYVGEPADGLDEDVQPNVPYRVRVENGKALWERADAGSSK